MARTEEKRSECVRPVDGECAGRWFKEAIGDPSLPLVKHQVPQCFEQYLRILHPAEDKYGQVVRWADLARRGGRVFYPEVQWHCLVGASEPMAAGDMWEGSLPSNGEMREADLDLLCRALNKYTDTPESCLLGLSTIHGWVEPLARGKALLTLPFRRFVVLLGPLKYAARLGTDQSDVEKAPGTGLRVEPGGSESRAGYEPVQHCGEAANEPKVFRYLVGNGGQAPNLIWPLDRAWCVVSEMDYDSTLIGGSEALIGELLETEGLECLSVTPSDSISSDADWVNC